MRKLLFLLFCISFLTGNAQENIEQIDYSHFVKQNNKFIIRQANDKYILFDAQDNKLFEVSDDHEIDIDGSSADFIRTYRLANFKTSGVFSLSKKKWLFEPGKYRNIYSFPNDRFAIEVSPNTYNFVNANGVVLNTLHNIENSYFNFQDYTDFLKVTSTSGKMGLLNPKTGKWILPCKFDQDMTWGGGKGVNRKIAVQQTTNKGELVAVYTVSGRKIASQFFPFGMKNRQRAVRNFGNRYLYH